MKGWLKICFNYSLSERRGIYLILFVFVVLIIKNQLTVYPEESVITPAYVKVDSIFNSIEMSSSLKGKKYYNNTRPKQRESIKKTKYYKKKFSSNTKERVQNIIVQTFDPNTISEEHLSNLPIDKYIINNIVKYRNVGGHFYNAEDLKKIYGMDDYNYNLIAPYVDIQKPKKLWKNNQYVNKTKKVISIEINSASAEMLTQLKGIGPILSKRIIKFRNRLGGFINLGQLKSTYGLEDSTYLSILPSLTLDINTNKLSLNSSDIKTLSSHPYISYKMAKIIINYREQHGNFNDINELSAIKILDSTSIIKISPYLSIEGTGLAINN